MIFSIVISDKQYEASLSQIDWPNGISVLISIFDGKKKYFESKVMCSVALEHTYDRVSKLTDEELLSEAWEIFKSGYPFDKLEKSLSVGLVVMLNWETEHDRKLKNRRAFHADIDKRKFIDRIVRAANRAKEFAFSLGYIDERVSENHIFTIYLNEDPKRELPTEEIIKILGGRKINRGDLRCMSAATTGKYLWIDGKVPEWINISVVNTTDEYTEFELTFTHRLAEANAVKLWPDIGMPEGNDLIPFRIRGPRDIDSDN